MQRRSRQREPGNHEKWRTLCGVQSFTVGQVRCHQSATDLITPGVLQPLRMHVRTTASIRVRHEHIHVLCSLIKPSFPSRPFSTFRDPRAPRCSSRTPAFFGFKFAFHCCLVTTSALTFCGSWLLFRYHRDDDHQHSCVHFTAHVPPPSTHGPLDVCRIRPRNPPVSTSLIPVPLGLALARPSLSFSYCPMIGPSKIPPLHGPTELQGLGLHCAVRLLQGEPKRC